LSDEQWQKFNERGGAQWLREFLDSTPRKPAGYSSVFAKAIQPKENHNGRT
jgi:hypothetical protein